MRIPPKYSLTSEMIEILGKIEANRQYLKSLNISSVINQKIQRVSLLKSSLFSAKIEGNPLSEAEVTNLLLNDRVPTNRDEKEVVRIITRHNEQVFRMLNAAIALLRTVSLPRAHKATINIKEQTLGTSLFLYDWIITPVCNCYNATITIESDFGISGIEISSYEFSDREPVSVHTISDSKLSRQLEEAAEKSLKEKILIAA